MPNESKLDAALSTAIVISFAALLAGNALAMFGGTVTFSLGNWLIVIALAAGTLFSITLAARIFWRHRIGLAAWMLMFGIHALAMAFATQLFDWVHPAPVGAAGAHPPGIDAMLLAFALIAALLIRGAVLLDAAARMPAWMAARKEGAGATPRIWLFALYWLSPLAWWGALLAASLMFIHNYSGAILPFVLVGCTVVILARVAVRIVLFEKNKYTNWTRQPRGWGKFRSMLNAGAYTLAGAITFYAYALQAARVEIDVFAARLDRDAAARTAEIKALQAPAVPPALNAERLYKLARGGLGPNVNWDWVQTSWNDPEAQKVVAANLTSLSYMRQGAALTGVDFGIDWTDTNSGLVSSLALKSEFDILGCYTLLEARQLASKGDWPAANINFKACLAFSRHLSTWLEYYQCSLALELEEKSALTLAAAMLDPNAHPTDEAMIEAQKMLHDHAEARAEFVSRALYFEVLRDSAIMRESMHSGVAGLPGNPSVAALIVFQPLVWATKTFDRESMISSLKIIAAQRIDRTDSEQLLARWSHLKFSRDMSEAYFANFEALEALRLAETAIGVKRYQHHYGSWPSTLNGCVPLFMPAVPPDPNRRGALIQYAPSPPRVYTIGTGMRGVPESHGVPEASYFNALELPLKHTEKGNTVLFLGN